MVFWFSYEVIRSENRSMGRLRKSKACEQKAVDKEESVNH